jgi:phospholipase C
MVISPYTRGGLVASEIFDHTSQLKFLERRFGVPVPNLSAWRRDATGDLTSAFDFARPPSDAVPPLPSADLDGLEALVRGNVNLLLGTLDHGEPYPVPPNSMPVQERVPVRGRPSGIQDAGHQDLAQAQPARPARGLGDRLRSWLRRPR